MCPERAPAPTVSRQAILASGLLDRDWVGAQLGAVFASDHDALHRHLDPDTDCSPHPLFEAAWAGRTLTAYLADRASQATISTHPLFDVERVLAEHPEAARHPYGPLSWWVGQAGEGTPVPVPEGVPEVTWGRLRAAALEAAERREVSADVRRVQRRMRRPPTPDPDPPALPTPGDEPLVTVVLTVHDDGPRLRAIVDAVQAQTYAGWELVVVDNGSADDTPAVLTGIAAFEPRVVPLTVSRGSTARARNAALGKARGTYVAFVDPAHTWQPDFLRVVVGPLAADAAPMAHAAMRMTGADGTWYRAIGGGRDHLLAHDHVDLACLVARRDLVAQVGGFDETLGGADGLDLLLRLSAVAPLRLVPDVLVERTDPTEDDPRWTATVLERHLVDWEAALHRPREPRRTTIVLSGSNDLGRTVRWVTRTMARRRETADVELVVVGSRMPREVELPLAMLMATYPDAELLALRPRVGPALATNIGIAHATGEVVVLARTSVNPPRDAFHALTTALEDHDVAIAQPLVVDRPGLVVSAGAVFGPGRTHPEPFLSGHPVSDAVALEPRRVPAPFSPVVAVRASELVQVRGLDVWVGDSIPEVELGIRLAHRSAHEAGGATVVVPQAPLVIKARQLPRCDTSSDDLAALQARWPSPPAGSDDAWARAGFEVVGRRWVAPPDASREPLDAPPLAPQTLVRPARAGVREGVPLLRWALDIAAPSGRRGQRWGDSYFAASLAEALQRLGQRVTVDTRDLRHRDTRDLDDVVLVLRGLDRVVPRPGRVNLEWVISHPDLVNARELASFDRVYAASATWAARTSAATGVDVVPLLQCTDPRVFNPTRGEPDTGAPVLFVGNSRDVYRRSVRSALAVGAEVEVHGLDWERFLSPERIASKIVANDELGAMYGSAGVVLNDHHDDMRRDGFLANRLFDAAACAARIVTDEIDGLAEVFGDVVKTFHDETEMRPLLADPASAFPTYDVRLALAETVVREHSFDHRAEVLLDDAVRLLSRW